MTGEAMCSRGFFTCVEREKKRRAGYEIKFAALDHEPGLVFCYGERALPSQDKDKPTLLFLHGLGTDKGTWYSVTRHLSSTQHCICLDLPGHGESSWKEDDDLNTAGFVKRIHEFVRATKMHKITGGIHIVGHSWGAVIAGQFAFKYGEEDGIRFLTLVSIPVHVPEPTECITAIRDGNFDNVFTPTEPEGMKTLYQTLFHKKRHWNSSKWFWQTSHEVKSPKFPYVRRIWEAIHEEMMTPSITTIRLGLWKNYCQTPMHVIWGERDKVYPSVGAEIVGDALQCKVTRIENAGHLVQQEEAKKVAEEIVDFRKKCIANKSKL